MRPYCHIVRRRSCGGGDGSGGEQRQNEKSHAKTLHGWAKVRETKTTVHYPRRVTIVTFSATCLEPPAE